MNEQILKEKIGKKITIFKLSDWGFPNSINCVIEKVERKDWAQYKNLLHIQYRPARKRTSYVIRIKDHTSIMFYDGYVDLKSDMFIKTLPSSSADVVVRESLRSFDNGYFHIAKNSTDQKPFLEIINE
jgi:hypothetical protein